MLDYLHGVIWCIEIALVALHAFCFEGVDVKIVQDPMKILQLDVALTEAARAYAVKTIEFSPDGTKLAVAQSDNIVQGSPTVSFESLVGEAHLLITRVTRVLDSGQFFSSYQIWGNL